MFTPRRVLRVNRFVWTWVMRLLSASVEPYLHRNFGRRYLLLLLGAALFATACAALPLPSSPLTDLYLLGLYGLFVYHAKQVWTRQNQGVVEPHSFSNGEPWQVWQRVPCSREEVEQYLEPALCAVASLLPLRDPFLRAWLASAAIALLVKGQLSRIKNLRRVLDAMDARHEAKALNAALTARQQPRGQASQKAHRARLPGTNRNP